MNSTATVSSAVRQKAVDYARRHWPIFPIRSIPAGGYPWEQTEGATDSAATLPGVSVADATADLLQVGRLWAKHPDAGIGLATGSASGLWALVVCGEAGCVILNQWTPPGERLPPTSRIKLGKNATIINLFRSPAGQPIPATVRLADDSISIVGEGSWVPLPPSAGAEGTCEWECSPTHASPAVAPNWMIARLTPQSLGGPRASEAMPTQPAPGGTAAVPALGRSAAKTPATKASLDAAEGAQKPTAPSMPPATHPSKSTISASGVDIKLDDEFARLIPAQSAEERDQLEANLRTEGCRDPLVVWKETGVLLDGYNRFDLCKKHGIPYKVVTVSLPDRKAARQWIIDNQRGRRNLSPAAIAYQCGKQYEVKKKAAGGTGANQHTRRAAAAQGGKNCHPAKTADKLAEQHKVSERTIRKDFQFAQAVDRITANCGGEARDMLLSRDALVRQQDIVHLAGLTATAQRQAIDELARTRRWKRPSTIKGTKTEPGAKGRQHPRPAASDSDAPPVFPMPGADPHAWAWHFVALHGPKVAMACHAALGKILAECGPEAQASPKAVGKGKTGRRKPATARAGR